MKLAKKIIIFIVAVFAVLYAAAFIFLRFQGKRIVTEQLTKALGRPAVIGSVSMPGFTVFRVINVQIEGIGKAASVDISPSILSLVSGKPVIYSIVVTRPELTYTKPLQQPVEAGGTSQPQAQAMQAARPGPMPQVIFHNLRIIDGVFTYIDRSVLPETGGISITATDLEAVVSNTYQFPKDIVTKFTFSADIPWKDSNEKGVVKLDGWMNYGRKDMRATLVVNDIDALYLYPYYSSWFSLDKANIQKAKLAFTSNVTGLNNDVTAECHLELTELNFKQREEDTEQSRSERIAQKVLQFFKAMNNGKVNLDFSIKTKMDSPEFGLNSVKNAFYSTLDQARREQGVTAAKVMEVPGKMVGGTVKGVSEVSSALISGVASVGREIGKSIKASFKKDSHVSDIPVGSVNETILAADQAPVEQMPVQQAPEALPPIGQTPVEQLPAEQAQVEQVPVEQVPAGQVQVEQIPVQQPLTEQTPAKQQSAAEISANETINNTGTGE